MVPVQPHGFGGRTTLPWRPSSRRYHARDDGSPGSGQMHWKLNGVTDFTVFVTRSKYVMLIVTVNAR